MRKVRITDKVLREHLESLPSDTREVFLAAEGNLRISAVAATTMVNEMRANHGTGLLETYMLGQGYVAGALLSAEVKGNDRIMLSIECGGPVKGMTIEAWACGAVRGYLMENPIPLEKPLSSLDTNEIYGPGFLSISKILEGSKTPFTGQIMMEYGHLAQDLALYYRQSQETPSLFSLSLSFDTLGRVRGAGGIFIQALPGCDEKVLEEVQNIASTFSDMGKRLGEGEKVRDYVERVFAPWGVVHLAHAPIGFSCPCSEKGYERYLSSLPEKEKKEILNGNFPLVLQCFNCSSTYSYTKERIEELFGL